MRAFLLPFSPHKWVQDSAASSANAAIVLNKSARVSALTDCATAKSLDSFLAIALLGLAAISQTAIAGGKACFLPGDYSETAALVEVDHQSAVCQAFRKELNATCGGPIPLVEFKPGIADSGLTLPKWEDILLYSADGSENSAGFAKLKELAYAKAFTTYFSEREFRAKRDTASILDRIRSAHAAGGRAIFQHTSLDLVGRGKPELLYRLYAREPHNPLYANEPLSRKQEPLLFLERAIKLAAANRPVPEANLGAGGNISSMSADTLLFNGVPYLMTWTDSYDVVIYSSYGNPHSPLTPTEIENQQTTIVPFERCVFEYK